MKTLVSRTFNN